MDIILIILAIYFINFFFGLKLLFYPNINLANSLYTLILIILFPFLTPFIFLFTIIDDHFRKQLIKKRKIDYENIPKLQEKSLTKNNDLTFFTNGEKLFTDMLKEIENAKHFIHLSFFTFNTDNIGKQFIKKLEAKLRENVEVVILYDRLGSFQQRKKYFQNFKKLGGKIIPFVKGYFNYRNHRKYLIIDNKIAYLGGFNIGDKYLGRDKKLGLWIDSQIKITGSAVYDIETRFLADYMYCLKKKIDYQKYLIEYEFTNNKQIEITSSGADISQLNLIENKILQYIYNAKQYIYIQTPYLILNDNFLKALIYAKKKNVEIKIMLPNKNDHLFVLQASKAYATMLLNYGIEIYLFNKNAFLHSKVFISDDYYLSIGTTNLDIRSFKYSLETNAFIYDKAFAEQIKVTFLKQITYCTKLKKGKSYYILCKLLSAIL